MNDQRADNPAGNSVAFDAELEAYLDGTLPQDRRAELEARAAVDGALQSRLHVQKRIDASLNRLFVYEGPAPLPVGAAMEPGQTGRAARSPGPSRQRLLGIAAAVALATAGLWYAGVPQRLFEPSAAGLVAPDDLYIRQEAAGFIPDWKCENDAEFAAVTNDRFGQPLLVKPASGVEVAGWTYRAPVFSDNTAVLLAKVNGRDVMVAVDASGHDRRVRTKAGSTLNLFKRRIGRVVLCEITPADEPGILPLFYVP